jgi:hypothetical protein
MRCLALHCSLILGLLLLSALAYQEVDPAPAGLIFQTPDQPGLDATPPPPATGREPKTVGPIAPAGTQPTGALSGRIVFTSAGHGWAWSGSAWSLGRGVLNEMNEDYGNLDQMSLFAYYCFNAGATVVPLRPIGNQTNEVVLDNGSPGVSYSGAWSTSSSTVFYGQAGDPAPYRYASASATESAVASYVPTIPAAGAYPVYTWVLHSSNRTNQLYRIRHTGGEAQVRVPHQLVGNGWVYLGTYQFNAGSNATNGAVLISNFVPGGGAAVVIADAIRFGNGLGSINRGGGVSNYPREEECARYWVQHSLGVGQSASIYDLSGYSDDSDNVGTPPRMAAEMNRESSGSLFQRVLVSFHSNASGATPATARGVVGLYNDPTLSADVAPNSNTPNQGQLAYLLGKEVNDDLAALTSSLEIAWHNRGTSVTYARSDYAFGEINNNALNGEMDATIVEVAFHDNAEDAKLLRDPKARNWVARACYQGLLRYFNQFDAAPLVFLPEPPVNVRATATGNGILLGWSVPVAQSGSGAATGFVVYRSSDGYGFGDPVGVAGAGATLFLVTNLPANTAFYFRVAATNAGGESLPSETVGCRRASNTALRRALIVNAFDRFDRTLNLRQTPSSRNYQPPGHGGNSGTMERVLPHRNNAFSYVVPHGQAISAYGQPFDSCQNEAVANGQVNLAAYGSVIWCCGNESTADETFNAAEQSRLTAYSAAGGNLFVSGSEIAWDLDRDSGPTSADRSFLRSTLHAALNGNTNDDSGSYTFAPVAGSIFAGNATGQFDNGSSGLYAVGYPDVLTPQGAGAAAALSYPGLGHGAAAVQYDGSAGGGRVVLLGFPFETITSASLRQEMLADALKFFRLPVRFTAVERLAPNQVRLTLAGEPGVTYAFHSSTNLTSWAPLTQLLNTNGAATLTDSTFGNVRRFYRATALP